MSYAPSLGIYLDFGCGSGVDAEVIGAKSGATKTICADIIDERTVFTSEFLRIIVDQPLDLPDGSINLVTIFHVIHHIMDDLSYRLDDIARIMVPGGILLVKDHDVTSEENARAVDFEHCVYLAGEKPDMNIGVMMRDFANVLPMKYYSKESICEALSINFDLLWKSPTSSITCVYNAVFRRK